MLGSADLATLKVQLDTTYNTQSNGTARDAINDPAGPNAISDFQVLQVSNVDAVAAVDGAEFKILTDVEQRGWLMITNLVQIPVKNPAIRALILDIWPLIGTYDGLATDGSDVSAEFPPRSWRIRHCEAGAAPITRRPTRQAQSVRDPTSGSPFPGLAAALVLALALEIVAGRGGRWPTGSYFQGRHLDPKTVIQTHRLDSRRLPTDAS